MMLRNYSFSWKSYIMLIEYTYDVIFHLIMLLCLYDALTLKGMRLEDLRSKLLMREFLPMMTKPLHLRKMLMLIKPPVNPPPMTEGEMKAILDQMAKE